MVYGEFSIEKHIDYLMKMYGVIGSFYLQKVLAATAVKDGLSMQEICQVMNIPEDKEDYIRGILNDLSTLYDEYDDNGTTRYSYKLESYRDYVKSEFKDEVDAVIEYMEN